MLSYLHLQAEPVQQRSKLSGEEKEGATKIDDKDKKGDSANDQQGCSTRTKAGEKPAIHSPAYGSWTGDGGNKKGSSSIGKLAWQMAQHSSLHGIGWYCSTKMPTEAFFPAPSDLSEAAHLSVRSGTRPVPTGASAWPPSPSPSS